MAEHQTIMLGPQTITQLFTTKYGTFSKYSSMFEILTGSEMSTFAILSNIKDKILLSYKDRTFSIHWFSIIYILAQYMRQDIHLEIKT